MSEFYCFDRFILNPDKRQLFSDGVPLLLGPTAVDILLALVEQPRKTVSKNDLMSRAWGRTAVSDNLLYVHIHELRKVLGDDCIVTKSGYGYRFITPVRKETSVTESTSPSANPNIGNIPSIRNGFEAAESTRLIGRKSELLAVIRHLAKERMLTLIGPGGVGKTSLALHAAEACTSRFPDGVWLVELAPLNDAVLVPGAVATALGIKISPGASPLDTLAGLLAHKKVLILLDNCEHVRLAAAGLSESLLRQCPDVRIVATSREALSCFGEQVFEVGPLALPPDGATPSGAMRKIASIRLFLERSKNADSNFRVDDKTLPIVGSICRHLDGLPLAIEMVSCWVSVLGLEALNSKLDGSLQEWLRARSTAPRRHFTLRDTLEWSHDLLSPDERIVLRRLAAFAGGFTMEAAQTVASGDGITENQTFEHLASLVRKSMVTIVPGTHSQKYRLLETTRAFALAKLAASRDAEAVRQRHASYVLQTLERAIDEWETTSDVVWSKRYAPLLDDLRAALDWAMSQNSDDEVALAGASWPLWRELSLLTEGRRWLGGAVSRLRPDTPPMLEARLRLGMGDLWGSTGAVRRAHDEFSRAAQLYRTLGPLPMLGLVLSRLAFALLVQGSSDEAEKAITESLILLEPSGWPRALATAYSMQVCVESWLGHYDRARAIGKKAMGLCRMIGADRTAFVISANLMECSLQIGDLESVIGIGRSLVTTNQNTFHSHVLGFVLGLLSGALIECGHLDEALAAARQAIPLVRYERMLLELFDHLALRAGLAGCMKDAARIIGYAESVHLASGLPREPIAKRASDRLYRLMRSRLPADEIVALRAEGALLTEDQAITLALAA